MNIIESLQQMGFTEYEAKAYIALLKNSKATGYEVSKLSGIPRAKIYQTLDSLTRKGAASFINIDGKTLYIATSYEVILSEYEDKVNIIVSGLKVELDKINSTRSIEEINILTDYTGILEKAKHICKNAKRRIYISVFPEELDFLSSEINNAKERGVEVFTLVYGQGKEVINDAVEHGMNTVQYLALAVYGRYLGVVGDQNESIIGQIFGKENSFAISTILPGIILPITLWIQHDIALYEILDKVAIPEDLMKKLRKMWFMEAGKGPKVEGVITSTLDDIFTLMCEKLHVYSRNLSTGVYQFYFTGEEKENYIFEIKSQNVHVKKGESDDADVRVYMNSIDFKGLVTGNLTQDVFFVKDRIKVQGDLALISQLSLLFK